MFSLNQYIEYETLSNLSSFFKIFFISLFSFITSLKLSNISLNKKYYNAIFVFFNILFSFVVAFSFPTMYTFPLIIAFVLISFIIINNFDLYHSIIVAIISLCLNFIAFFVASLVVFPFSFLGNFTNTNLLMPVILIVYTFIILKLLKSKRLKYGLSYLNKFNQNENLDLILLNVSLVIIFFFLLIPRLNNYFSKTTITILFFYSIIMAITIYKSFALYYKHNLLVKELNETKLELVKRDEEIARLEKENLEFSKTSHSIAHKQKALEYRLNQLMQDTEFSNELDISNRLQEISKEYSPNMVVLDLPQTGIPNIDNLLGYMQSECAKSNINFELQVNGDIFSMVTNIINKEKLEILLADHIKNAIIAVNSSDNINRSILVKLDLIDGIYSIYFYDSGIEFEQNVLGLLGKEQITTHKDVGGSGCGFLNTFDTLKEYNASLEIKEISSPCKDNYTKSIVIKFDGNNNFSINSYKKIEH